MIKSPGGATLGSSPNFGAVTATTVNAGNLANVIARNAIPFVIAPTGTMANNGAITVGTALATTYANCYLNLPLNAIQAGSAAGWYLTQMSSATAGTVFNNPYTTGLPTLPATVPFVTTGPGAYAGVTSLVTGPQITLAANTMSGPNSILRSLLLTNELNNANAKTLTLTVGAANFVNAGLASVGAALTTSAIFNQGSQTAQVSMPTASNIGLGSASANLLHSAVNFAQAQTYAIGLTMAVATDYLALEGFLIEVVP